MAERVLEGSGRLTQKEIACIAGEGAWQIWRALEGRPMRLRQEEDKAEG